MFNQPKSMGQGRWMGGWHIDLEGGVQEQVAKTRCRGHTKLLFRLPREYFWAYIFFLLPRGHWSVHFVS